MPQVKSVFERTEKKYLITSAQRGLLLDMMSDRMHPDEFGRSTVCSLYFDTPDYRMIRRSIEKPVYKEKMRLRCYGCPDDASPVYLELKKKYKGIVYKRRQTMTLEQAKRYVAEGTLPCDTQIMREIDFTSRSYGGLIPTALVIYDREAFFADGDDDFRITFDGNLRFRISELFPDAGLSGRRLTGDDTYIMEVKSPGGMPVWLADMLDSQKIYPCSFSKYGTVYEKYIFTEEHSYA